MLDYLRNSVIATLIYYDILDFPLTLLEIHSYLINPGRVGKIPKDGVVDIGLRKVLDTMETLVRARIVSQKNGFYFLEGRDSICDIRMSREKIAAQKWKRLSRIGRFFNCVPYLRGMWVSGSLAIYNSEKESDLDVLVIAKTGRLYTARMLLSGLASTLRARRNRYQTIAPDKFCFNHYLADKHMEIQQQSLYAAQAYNILKPFLGPPGLLTSFYNSNIWLHQYIINAGHSKIMVVPNETKLNKLAKAGEFLLDNIIGDGLEIILKWYQRRRIFRNPVTYESGGRIICTDNVLEFHPKSFERKLLYEYNKRLQKYGIVPPKPEGDSGLLTH